jgi:hypothetical protein
VYGLTNVIGGYTGSLSNGGGLVRLRKRSGAVLIEVNYSDAMPWPVAADGAGPSLVLARPSLGEADPRAWAASASVGGSPGEADPLPTGLLAGVVINECLAHPQPGDADFVELHNRDLAPADLSGCWLQGGDESARFRIPDGTMLGPGGYCAETSATICQPQARARSYSHRTARACSMPCVGEDKHGE